MRNFVQPGEVVTLPAPVGGIKSGEAALIGALFGVASYDALEGAPCEFALVGVYELPAVGPINGAAAVNWDGGSKKITAGAGPAVGVAIEAVGGAGTTAKVRLNGVAVA